MKRTKLIILCLLAVVLGGTVLLALRSKEARYEGRTLNEWLDSAKVAPWEANPPNPTNYVRALCYFGTNAIPPLLQMLQSEDLGAVLTVKGALPRELWAAFHMSLARDHRLRAVSGFTALGPIAKPAIPQISALLDKPKIALDVVCALNAIGPDAAPALVHALTNQNTEVRGRAMKYLTPYAQSTSGAIPALLDRLKDPDYQLRIYTVHTLQAIRLEAGMAVPELTRLLADPIDLVRGTSADALSPFKAEARSAVPALQTMLKDSSPYARTHATNALLQIAPEVIARAGVQ